MPVRAEPNVLGADNQPATFLVDPPREVRIMMAGFRRLVALTAVVGAPALAAGQSTRTGTLGPELVMPTVSASATAAASVPQTASLTSGWIEGQVTDDGSRPIVGAAV